MNEAKYNYMGKRYIALVRASNDTEGTTSTEAQLQLLHAKAKQLGMTSIDEVILDGVTGSMPAKRKDLADILDRKRQKNDFDVLIVQRLDRLTRSGATHGMWFEQECILAGIHLLITGDDIPDGRYAALIKVAKYGAAQEQAFSISQRSCQGYQMALEQGRVTTSTHTPYGCWRLYLSAGDKPLHIIRDLGDGRQQKLDPISHAVVDTYGQVGGNAKGHYRKQKSEKVQLMIGDADDVATIRDIFNLHFRQGWGGKRIADHLNRKSIPSPQGRTWSQRQVEVIYNQECYTGRSVGNRTSSGIYHQRSASAPKEVHLDPSVHANAKTIPPRLRPKEEWFVVEQPLLKDFLGDEQLRALAIAGQDKFWNHLADADRPKLSKSKHKNSDYLLSGLLFAKQDGGPLVGILCGRVGKKVRYYRHRRDRTGYMTGSVFNKLIHAEAVEHAVLDAIKATLLDHENLKERLMTIIETESKSSMVVDVEQLKRQREKLKKRTELIIANFDEESLADAQSELEKLKADRRRLDDQIASAAAQATTPMIDADTVAERIVEKTKIFFGEVTQLPNHLLREWIGAVISKITVDMETKNIEIEIGLSPKAMETALSAEKSTRLVTTSASSTDYQTHQSMILVGVVQCDWIKRSSQICYRCQRKAA